MPLQGIHKLTGLTLCLSGLIPASGQAAPDLARATATVSATILAPVSIGINYTANTRQARLRVTRPDGLIFQLHINNTRHHSYTQAPSEQTYPLPNSTPQLKLYQNSSKSTYVTLYFN